jgi:hypothetical protein
MINELNDINLLKKLLYSDIVTPDQKKFKLYEILKNNNYYYSFCNGEIGKKNLILVNILNHCEICNQCINSNISHCIFCNKCVKIKNLYNCQNCDFCKIIKILLKINNL